MNLMVWWVLAGLVVIAGATAVWWGSRSAARGANQLMYPRHTQPGQTPADYHLTAETVRIPVDDIELAAWYISPAESAGGAALIFVHGFGGNRGALLEQAAAMHNLGYGALLLDLRNHGDSGEAVTTWGYSEANDVLAAYRYLVSRPEVDPQRIGLVGKSMGGAAVALAAAQLPELAVLVLESTYTSFEENLPNITAGIVRVPRFLAPLIFNRMAATTDLPLTDISTQTTVTELTVPLLVIHGEADQLVPLEQAQAIFAAANEPKALYSVPGAGHLNIFTINPAGFTEQMGTFLAAHLR